MYKIIMLFALSAILSLTAAAEGDHSQCTSCHLQDDSAELLLPLPDLCISCHLQRMAQGEHVINVPPTSIPVPQLPMINGLISCTTCHDPHANSSGQLRLAREQLCFACHKF